MVILRIRPLGFFSIVTAELKRVASSGRFMMVEGTLHPGQTGDGPEALHQLAQLCDELTADNLYKRYANRQVFPHTQDFWTTDNTAVRSHVKLMADQRLQKAIRLAATLDVPMLYVDSEQSRLNIDERLTLDENCRATPVMNFSRNDAGTVYRLQLRIGERLIEVPCDHRLTVLTHEPGLFTLDGTICQFDEGFSGQLLMPFTKKAEVVIPRRIENDYFRRFILRHVVRAEINAEGFDIEDCSVAPLPCLMTNKTVDGRQILTLRFRYGNTEFSPDSRRSGQVTLTETGDSFRFRRQKRDRQREEQLAQLLTQTGVQMTADGHIAFPTTADMVNWLRQQGATLRAQGFNVVQPSSHHYYIGPLNVEQSDQWQNDWLQTNVTIVLDDGRLRIPFYELRDTILRGEQEYMLPTGEVLLIPEEWLQRYADLLLVGTRSGQGFRRHRCQTEGGQQPSTLHGEQPPAVRTEPPAALRATLRPYQLAGFQWLWNNLMARAGCCLSDEMGLGKTLQTIALLLKYKEETKAATAPQPAPGMLFTEEEMQGTSPLHQEESLHPSPFTFHLSPKKNPSPKPALVVAPASVVHNWRNELQRFAPSLLTLTYTGDVNQRRDKRKTLTQWDVVLTTYRTLLNDIGHLSELPFSVAVFDESQAFKTASSQIHQAVKSLQAEHCIALSGTPVENNLMELWSLMNVLVPNLLGDAKSFQQSFVAPIARQMEESRSQLLRRLIKPYFLKRTKEEVLSDLPERQDEVVVCSMTDQQASLYASELSQARNEWLDPQTPQHSRQMNILAAIQRLRQIANGEGKMAVVFEHLENLRSTRHKVLIFSEYVSLLERVAEGMRSRDWQYDLLTGQTQHREQVIAHFQQTADTQFFLISLKAGGVGLNLTAADYVFLLDPWWNQSAEEQAIARAHRIGQHHPVFVYRFVTADTLEEQILNMQERKQTLIDSVMPFICDAGDAAGV